VKILITGGSGFVGAEIVRQALTAGHAVRVLSRGTRSAVPGVENVRGSVLDPTSLPAALDGMEAVLHLVGIISEIGDQTYERVHTEGTRHVVEAARAAGVSRYVHMSALGTRPQARARYHQSKWEAEQWVRASPLDWTILRPSLIYGAGDGFVTLFARLGRWSPLMPVFGPGTHQLQPVAVEDVARCFVGALSKRAAVACTLDVCGRERFSMNEILSLILEATGRTRLKIHLPWAMADLQARLLEAVFPKVLGQAPPLNRDQIRMLQEDNIGDPEPACRMFGFEPVRFREGIRRFLRA